MPPPWRCAPTSSGCHCPRQRCPSGAGRGSSCAAASWESAASPDRPWGRERFLPPSPGAVIDGIGEQGAGEERKRRIEGKNGHLECNCVEDDAVGFAKRLLSGQEKETQPRKREKKDTQKLVYLVDFNK